MAKFLGFLLGVAVALAGPAVFGVLAAPGGIELNTKEMALAYGIGALIFWAVASYFSGAGALGAFVAFGALIYCWLWIPNRTTNFLNDVPGVTTGMIDGSRRYTLNGVVPILAVISLVYAIQLIVHSVQRRRRERVEADRLQREQEAAQAEQEADAAAVYPVAGSTYPAYGESFGNRSRFDDLFDDEQEPVQPRNQAEDQTDQYPTAGAEHTAQFRGAAPEDDASGNYPGDDTVLVPTDRDETVQVPAQQPEAAPAPQQPAGGAPAAGAAAVAGAAVAAERHESQQEKTVTPDDAPTAVAPQQPAAAPKVAPEQPAAAPEVKQPQAKQEPAPDADDATQGAPSAEPQAEQASPAAQAPVADTDEDVTQQAPQVEPQVVPAPAAKAEQAPASADVDEDATQEAPRVEPPAPPVKAEQAPGPDTDDDATREAPRVEPPTARSQAEQAPAGNAEQAPAGNAGQVPQGSPGKEERMAGAVPTAREQMGSQYRERMDDPEDTGEIHMTAFENPVVRPAGA